MKNVNCQDFAPKNKNGQTERCNCAYLNRKWARGLKLYKMEKALQSHGKVDNGSQRAQDK